MSDKKEIVATDSKKVIIRMIIFIVAVIALVASFILFITSGSVALNSAIKSSEETFLSEKEKTYEDFKETFMELGENNHHVSNRVDIDITSIKTDNRLQVLEVINTEYINCDEPDEKITAWFEVKGKGIYTVNMEAAEYIIDNRHSTVSVRVPKPELAITDSVVENKFFVDDSILKNGSVAKGSRLYEEAKVKGANVIKEEFSTNTDYYEIAEESAEIAISNLVYEVNQGVKDLKVTVEFY